MQRDIVIGAGLVIAGIATAAVLLVRDARRVATPISLPEPAPAVVTAPPPKPAPQIAPATAPMVVVAPQPRPLPPASAPTVQKWTGAPQGRRGPNAAPAAPVTEPAARDALGRVGFDPAADDVYIAAINDPNLAPNQRKNLIEDLNET